MNTPEQMDIMDEQEKDLIRKEFTMCEQVNTEFTEFSICSEESGDDNISEKSLVFCPFNSINK
jgi:hypothetical protein